MRTVTLIMTDILEEKTVERTIDAVNAYSSGSDSYELKSEAEQRANLERWISERGNQQHDTLLDLISWTFNN